MHCERTAGIGNVSCSRADPSLCEFTLFGLRDLWSLCHLFQTLHVDDETLLLSSGTDVVALYLPSIDFKGSLVLSRVGSGPHKLLPLLLA